MIISPIGGGTVCLACAIGISLRLNEHTLTFARMDDLARRLVITRSEGIAHHQLLNELSDAHLLLVDDFLTAGIDSDAANNLFAVLANPERRLPTLNASQSGPSYRE
jgi:DNA replication protein DnaC